MKSLKKWVKSKKGSNYYKKNNFNVLRKHILFPKKTAIYKIARDLYKLSGERVKPSHINNKNKKNIKIKIQSLNIINFVMRLINKFYKKPNYIPKVYKKNKLQDGIKLHECNHYLSLMYPDLDWDLEEANSNLIRIEALNS